MPAQIQLKTGKMVELGPESDVPRPRVKVAGTVVDIHLVRVRKVRVHGRVVGKDEIGGPGRFGIVLRDRATLVPRELGGLQGIGGEERGLLLGPDRARRLVGAVAAAFEPDEPVIHRRVGRGAVIPNTQTRKLVSRQKRKKGWGGSAGRLDRVGSGAARTMGV